jgi:hypothetical protein
VINNVDKDNYRKIEALTSYGIIYGRNVPPPERIHLKSGCLDLVFQDGDLRYIQFGETELVRRVYVAIRDVNWNTIPGKITDLRADIKENCFSITFNSQHKAGNLDFAWQALITGTRDGQISYSLDGAANTDFRYCRIGFCILHPIREYAGRPYEAVTPGGGLAGYFPILIEPQRIEGNFEAPLFPSCSSLSVRLENNLEVHTDFEGDLFEVEDQRNWTDGSFKTYCTPSSMGYPHNATPGQRIYQKIYIWMSGETAAHRIEPAQQLDQIKLFTGGPTQKKLPVIGFGLPSPNTHLSAQEVKLLCGLRPAHLKAELHFKDANWEQDLETAIRASQGLQTSLELAIFLANNNSDQLKRLHSLLKEVPVERLIVFHEGEAAFQTTSRKWLELVREHLGNAFPGVPIAGGTNGNFAELNRDRPDISIMDEVSYSINPQVHSWDEASLIEALEAQADTVITARSFCGSLPIVISSVTLKPPFNQAATEQDLPPLPGELPLPVDQRQISLFGAAWTVGSLKYLAEAGATSITYYETIGWRGLIERQGGSLIPGSFLSSPGMVFPVYHIFADLADFKDADIYSCHSSQPLAAAGLYLHCNNRWQLLIANLKFASQNILVGPLPTDRLKIRSLDENTAALSMFDPEQFRASFETLVREGQELAITLKPYGIIKINWEE